MMVIHLGLMFPLTSSGYLGTRRARLRMSPILPCSRWGLPSPISHLMGWCAFTAPFHLYNVLRRCSLLSVALSIASPLLGVIQHPALWSPDFPHPVFGTRPSTQLKSFYYTIYRFFLAIPIFCGRFVHYFSGYLWVAHPVCMRAYEARLQTGKGAQGY